MERQRHLADLLSTTYQEYIYKRLFLILNPKDYTSNSNGIFIKLNDIASPTIEKGIEFLESINSSKLQYQASETTREIAIKQVQNFIKIPPVPKKQAVKTVRAKGKPQREPKALTGVYKRISQCMGRRGYQRKPDVYKGDSDDYASSASDTDTKTESGPSDSEPTLKELGLEDSDDDTCSEKSSVTASSCTRATTR